MVQRTITGAVITVFTCLFLYFSYMPEVVLWGTFILGVCSVYEVYRAAGMKDSIQKLLPAILAAIVLILVPVPDYGSLMAYLFPMAIFYFALLMMKQEHFQFDTARKTLLTSVILLLLLKAIPCLRSLDNGLYYLAGAILACFATDVAAYLIGSRFGRHKLLPKVSPKKTVEGSVAGIATTVLALCLYGLLVEKSCIASVNWMNLAIYAAGASVVGQFGDLSLSVIKRICGVKDYGNLLPGHGGILDRFDSQLFAVAFTLLFCSVNGGYLI